MASAFWGSSLPERKMIADQRSGRLLQMDEDIGKSNKFIVDSLHDYKVIHAKVPNVNMKRKLEDEQLYFPLSKHMFGYRSSGCEHEQILANESDEMEMTKGKRAAELAHDTFEHSFVYGDAEDEKTPEPKYPSQTCTYAQSYTSLGSCSSNSLKDSLPSLDRGSIQEPNNFGKEEQEIVAGVTQSNFPKVKDQLQFGGRAQLSVDAKQLEDGFECCLDEELEDETVYSNGPLVTNFCLSPSERWIINKEKQPGPKGPTIDQEFEQYFSTLLL